ncbi:MAG: ATP-binding protein [Syntrophales bacterium LBB04]|nr:ATP-binding protein [Syntrophales bacterium LBB04]
MMVKEYTLRQQIERNGLILIALFMILIYWFIDSLASDQVLSRALIACFVIIYGIFTQILINSRKEALEEKERSQKQMIQSEKLAALGVVAAGIAHEVKNPLAIIIQGVEYLRTSIDSDVHIADILDRIKRSAFRADSIIKGLLSFTRQMPIQTEQVEIPPVIEETLSFIDHQLKVKHIKLVKEFSPGLPKVTVDSNQIKQVFLNLLLNSIDAIKDRGTITISAEKVENTPGEIHVQITLADTGCGIPKDRIEKVFDPFYTTKDSSGNAGLGLSIAKGIIDKHHGTVEIESESEGGTCVIIALPASDPV